MARRLRLGAGSAAASAPAAAATFPGKPSGSRTDMVSSGSVRVPVLSTHTTSTRARPSMAASSWTSTRRRPRRTTPTAKATDVSRTRPSGIMLPTPATEPRTASATPSPAASWLSTSSTAAGTITQVTRRRMVSIPRRSSEGTRAKRRASSARRRA